MPKLQNRIAVFSLIFAGTFTIFAQGSHAGSSTVRIETGTPQAVTIARESGVLVFRALPPTEKVIINPGGQTPLNLIINEKRVYETKNTYKYVSGPKR